MSGPPVFTDADFSTEKTEEDKKLNSGGKLGRVTSSESGKESPMSYITKSAVTGAGEQMGRNFEAAVPIQLEGIVGIPESLLRQFLPRELVNKVFPSGGLMDPMLYDKEGKPQGTVRQRLLDKDNITSPENFRERAGRGESPGTMSRIVGAGAEGFGAMASNPVGAPRNLIRSTLMAFGSGMGGEEGGRAGKGLGRTFGGLFDDWFGTKHGAEIGERAGEVTGSLAGGAVGAQLNVTRGKAAGLAKDVIKDAAALRKEGARRDLVKNFQDNYGDLNDEGKTLIQDHVNTKLAETLQKNPETPQNMTAFEEAAKRVGVDPKTFDLAQRTADPSLITATSTLEPRNLEEAQALVRQRQTQRKDIVSALERTTGEKAKPEEVVAALEDARRSTNARVVTIEAQKKQAQDVVTHLTPQERATQGQKIQDAYHQQMEEVKPIRDSWYAKVETSDTLSPGKYDLKPVEGKLKDVLGSWLSKTDRSTVPESVVKLEGLLQRSKGTEDSIKRTQNVHGIWETEKIPGTKANPPTTKDLMDVFKALNREVPKDRTEARNLAMVREELTRVFEKGASKETVRAFQEANQNYATLYAPMFKNGVNGNLDRRAGINRQGESYYSPDKGMAPFLKKDELVSRMQNFEDLFGGTKLGKKNEEAYKELGRAIEDQYHHDMFQGGKYTQAKHDQFMREYGPVFDKVPQAREQIEKQAAQVFEKQGQIAREEQQYKEMVRSPLDETIGSVKAEKLVSDALVDPRRMRGLISAMDKHGGAEILKKDTTRRFNLSTNGEFDPFKMEDVLKKSEPGLRVLYEKTEGGILQADAHLKALNDIALLAKRHSIMDVRPMQSRERLSTDPIKQATGSQGASIMSYWRSYSQGYTSAPYVGVLAGGRYLNQALQNSLRDAELKAFNDPKMAQAVLELYSKKEGEAVSEKSARYVLRAGGNLAATTADKVIDWLIDKKFVKQTMGKGAQIGVTQEENEKERKRESSLSR